MIIEQIGVKKLGEYSAPVIGVTLSVLQFPVGRVETFVFDGRQDQKVAEDRYKAIIDELFGDKKTVFAANDQTSKDSLIISVEAVDSASLSRVEEAALRAEAGFLVAHLDAQGTGAGSKLASKYAAMNDVAMSKQGKYNRFDQEEVNKQTAAVYPTLAF